MLPVSSMGSGGACKHRMAAKREAISAACLTFNHPILADTLPGPRSHRRTGHLGITSLLYNSRMLDQGRSTTRGHSSVAPRFRKTSQGGRGCWLESLNHGESFGGQCLRPLPHARQVKTLSHKHVSMYQNERFLARNESRNGCESGP